MKRPRPVPGLDCSPLTRPNFSKISDWCSRSDARPAVPDLDADAPVLGKRFDLHLAAGRRVLDGVVDQVRDHLPEPLAVAADGGSGRWTFAVTCTSSWPLSAAAADSWTSSPRSTSANE